MTNESFEKRLTGVGVDGRVTADEVLHLRRTVFADGVVSNAELNALFDLGDRAPEGDPEWGQFFAEAVADFYLREEQPQGYLTAEEFDSLKARLTRDGHIVNSLELETLVKLMETAMQTPPALAAFTGEQFKIAVLNKPDAPHVTTREASLMKRYIFASGGDGNVGVTKREAELLFDINDATDKSRNSPAWTELFVQGIVNHLMANLGYTAPSREEAFRRNAWVRDQSVNVGGFFKRMISGGVGAVRDAYEQGDLQNEKADARDAAAKAAADVTATEAAWLASRIGRDGAFDAAERRLIARMKELEKELPDELKQLVERAA